MEDRQISICLAFQVSKLEHVSSQKTLYLQPTTHAVAMLMNVTGIITGTFATENSPIFTNTNRCLVPTALPDEAKLQIEVSRDCNHSLLNKQPTQTMSPSLTSTDPSSSEGS